jgi:hypothetical protein
MIYREKQQKIGKIVENALIVPIAIYPPQQCQKEPLYGKALS